MLNKIKNVLAKISFVIPAAALIIMVVMVFVDVVIRTMFSKSLLITDEMSGYLMVVIVYWGAVLSFKEGGFVRVDALFNALNERLRNLLEIIYQFVFAIFNAVMCYFAYEQFASAVRFSTISATIAKTPLAIPKGMMAFGMIFFEIYLIIDLIDRLRVKEDKK